MRLCTVKAQMLHVLFSFFVAFLSFCVFFCFKIAGRVLKRHTNEANIQHPPQPPLLTVGTRPMWLWCVLHCTGGNGEVLQLTGRCINAGHVWLCSKGGTKVYFVPTIAHPLLFYPLSSTIISGASEIFYQPEIATLQMILVGHVILIVCAPGGGEYFSRYSAYFE